jgi:pimeloyl-ACP methyl ester carboxylesterase
MSEGRATLHLAAFALAWAVLLGGCFDQPEPGPEAQRDHLVLLHGLGRSAGSMRVLENRFEELGYRVTNVDYPGRFHGIPDLAEKIAGTLDPLCADQSAKVHFITHSMGGILLRYHMKHRGCPAFGRAVMLAPPNQGTELVDLLGEGELFRWATGPAAQELGTGSGSVLGELGPVDFELGVIAGNAPIPVSSALIPGEDDGIVSVESTRVEGMKDHLVVPSTHSFLMNSETVIEQARHFIETGAFRPGSDVPTYPRR